MFSLFLFDVFKRFNVWNDIFIFELKKSIQKKLNKLDTNLTERTVGSNLVSYNPYTGFAEFGFFSNLWKKVKKVIDPVTKVAQFIPGPWQAPSAIYQKGKAAVDIVKPAPPAVS